MKRISLKFDNPYSASSDIIYIEPRYDAGCNRYINENYDAICELCESKGLRFIYLPKCLPSLLADEDLLKYNLPGCKKFDLKNRNKAAKRIYKFYYKFIKEYISCSFWDKYFGGYLKNIVSQPIFLFTYSKDYWFYSEAGNDITEIINICAKHNSERGI